MLLEWTGYGHEGNRDFIKIYLGQGYPSLFISLVETAKQSAHYSRLIKIREAEKELARESFEFKVPRNLSVAQRHQ